MTLIDYIKTIPTGKRISVIRKIANSLGISKSYMFHMSNGTRPIPIKYAVPLEKATNGIVGRQDTAPHMYE